MARTDQHVGFMNAGLGTDPPGLQCDGGHPCLLATQGAPAMSQRELLAPPLANHHAW